MFEVTSRSTRFVALLLVTGPAWAQTISPEDYQQGIPNRTPNILLILADDLGAEQVGVYSSAMPAPVVPVTWTPRIDGLASTGTVFTRCWSNPVCSPSRAAIHTGEHALTPEGHGVLNTSEAIWGKVEDDCVAADPSTGNGIFLRLNQLTLPEHLSATTGYAHALFGKWHLDYPTIEGVWGPAAHGWSCFQGVLGGGHPDYYNWCRFVASSSNPIPTLDSSESVCVPASPRPTPVSGYSTTRIVDDALRWITSRPRNRPWFCTVSFTAPHHPFQLPPNQLTPITNPVTAPCPPEPDCRPVEIYRSMVEAMDTEIGRLIDSLGEDAENTLIIFTSDNGTPPDVVEEPFLDPNTDCTRGKGTPYEGGVRVPLIVRGPEVMGPVESRELVHLADLFNTIADYTGAGVLPSLPSRSLRRVLEGSSGYVGRTAMYTDSGGATLIGFCPDETPNCPPCRSLVGPHRNIEPFYAARDGSGFKLVQYVLPPGINPPCNYPPFTKPCGGLPSPACYPESSPNGYCGELFFDLAQDPFELNPLDLDPFAMTSEQSEAYSDLRVLLETSVYGPGPAGPWPPRSGP